MKLKDLLTDAANPDQLSHTKLWTNIAYLTATVTFIMQAYKGTLEADIWLIYLGVLGAHSTASKLISLRYGGTDKGESNAP